MYAYGPPPGLQQEFTFFQGQGVQVTNARFIVSGQMYPISAITSVAPFSIQPQRAGLIFLAVLLGLLGVLCAAGGSLGAFLFFEACAGICVWVALVRKAVHGIMIATSGMQVRALASGDLPFVQQVLAGLHQAVASR